MYPVIDSIKKDMIEHGAMNAIDEWQRTDSFGIFPDEQSMIACQQFLRQKGEARQVYTTENIYTIIYMEIIHIQSNRERQGFI